MHFCVGQDDYLSHLHNVLIMCFCVEQDALCETTYQAEVAGLVCYVSPEGGASLAVRLDGFSHRLLDLADVVFRTLATLQACTSPGS